MATCQEGRDLDGRSSEPFHCPFFGAAAPADDELLQTRDYRPSGVMCGGALGGPERQSEEGDQRGAVRIGATGSEDPSEILAEDPEDGDADQTEEQRGPPGTGTQYAEADE